MSTPDASQFTQKKRYQAFLGHKQGGGPKQITHLYAPFPSTTGLPDFLPSFSGKRAQPVRNVPINFITGLQYKTRRPASQFMS